MTDNCNCGHHHDHEERPLNKYEQALSKYRTKISDEEVRNAVKQIIAEKVHENDNLEVKKFLMGKSTSLTRPTLTYPTWLRSAYIHASPRP